MTDDTDNICPQCGGPRRAERDGQRRYRPGSIVEDPFYTGPHGHCPDGLCAECWEAHWHEVLESMAAGKDWRRLGYALYLTTQGYTHAEAAAEVGVCVRTFYNWRQRAKKDSQSGDFRCRK